MRKERRSDAGMVSGLTVPMLGELAKFRFVERNAVDDAAERPPGRDVGTGGFAPIVTSILGFGHAIEDAALSRSRRTTP